MANDTFLVKVGVDVKASYTNVKKEIQDLLNVQLTAQDRSLNLSVNRQTLVTSINNTLSNAQYADLNVKLSTTSVANIQKGISKAIVDMQVADRSVIVHANTEHIKTELKTAITQAQRESLNLDIAEGGLANLQSSIQVAFKRALQSPDIIVPSIDTATLEAKIEASLKKFHGYKLRINPIVYGPTAPPAPPSGGGSGGNGGGGGNSGDTRDYSSLMSKLSKKDATFKTLSSILKTDIYKDISIPIDERNKVEHLTRSAQNLLNVINTFPKDPILDQWVIVDEDAANTAQKFIKIVNELSNAQQKAITSAKSLQKPSKDMTSDGKFHLETLRSYDTLINTLESGAITPDRRKGLTKLKEAFAVYEKSPQAKQDVEALAQAIRKVEINLRNVHAMSKTAGEKLEYMLGTKIGYAVITAGLMAVRRAIRQLYTNVLELDTAMTELKKVTDETDEAYERFLKDAAKRARDFGASLVDVVSATADAARLGLNIGDASALADAAIVYKNVGDGIADVNEASESIISTMQAFGIEAQYSMQIVDKFNEVANNFAISAKGIGDAMLNSASALEAANNTIDESVAMITATNEVIQDPQKVGTALKTVSMYLRAAKTEAEDAGESTDGMADSVSELREELLSLTGNRVDIMVDDNTFKSTFQIMKELSQVWDDLSDVSRANILEMIGGKRNSNVVTALLGNFDQAEKALATSLNSAGSALKENEKYLESIQGKLNQLSAAWQTLSNNLLDSGVVKLVVDGLRLILDLMNKLDETTGGLASWILLFGTAGVIIKSVIGAFKNDLFGLSGIIATLSAITKQNTREMEANTRAKQRNAQTTRELTKQNVKYVASKKAELITNGESPSTFGKLSSKLKSAGKAILEFVEMNPLAAITIAAVGTTVAVIALSNAIDKIKLNKAKENAAELESELQQLGAEFDTNKSRIEELQRLADSGEIDLIEQQELNNLKLKNDLLQDQIELQKELLDIENQKIFSAANKMTDDYFSNGRYGGMATSGSEESERLLNELERAQNSLTWEHADDAIRSQAQATIDRTTEALRKQQADLLTLMSDLDVTDAVGRANFNKLQAEYDRISVAIGGATEYADAFQNTLNRNASAELLLNKIAESGELTATKLQKLYESSPDSSAIKQFIDELIRIGIVEEDDADKWRNIVNFFRDIETEANDATVALVPLATMIEKTDGASELLTKAKKEMNETGYIELDTVKSILSEYPDLEKYILQTADGYQLATNALSDHLQAQHEQYQNAFNEARTAAAEIIEQETNKKVAIDATTESIIAQLNTLKTDAQYRKASAYSKMTDWLIKYGNEGATKDPVYMYWFNQYKDAIKDYGLLSDTLQNLDNASMNAQNSSAVKNSVLREYAKGTTPDEPDYDKIHKELVDQKELVEQKSERLSRMSGDFSAEQITMWGDLRKEIIKTMASVEKGTDEYHYLEDMLWEVNDAIEEIYDNQTDAIQNIIDLTREMIEEEYEDAKDAIEKQVDTYNDLIDKKKEALRVDKEANDYNKKVAEKTKEIAKLQSRIAILSLDDSREAQAEKIALEEELAKLQSDLADIQADRALEITEDALDKSAEEFEDAKDKELEALEDILDDEARLYKETIEKIGNMENSFYLQLEKWAKEHGKDIRELAKDWDVAKNAKKGYTDLDAALSGIAGNKDGLGSTTTDGNYIALTAQEIIDQMRANSIWAKEHGTSWDSTRNISLHQENKSLAKQYEQLTGVALEYDPKLGWVYAGTQKPVYKFHTGGIVGGRGSLRDNELMSILETNEIVMANGHKMNLSSLFDNLRSTIGELVSGNLMNNMNRMRAVAPAGGNTIAPEINVTIQHNGEMSDADAKKYGSMVGDEALKKLHSAFVKRGL